ncbi:hypothetical protein DsansV1_C49g0244041 [Dioscorea sansibarensis]
MFSMVASVEQIQAAVVLQDVANQLLLIMFRVGRRCISLHAIFRVQVSRGKVRITLMSVSRGRSCNCWSSEMEEFYLVSYSF